MQITKRRLRAVENALAQQRIEGLTVPPETVEAMRKVARGEISVEDGIHSTFGKFTHGKIRGEGPLP
jgi:hypothetical protein